MSSSTSSGSESRRADHDAPAEDMGQSYGMTEFSVGIDVEEVERFDMMRSHAPARSMFSDEEWEHCSSFADAAARLAGTWCAKEAVVKALWPWVRLDPRRVLVSRAGDGRPQVRISGWDATAEQIEIRISISHSASTACASAIAWRQAATRETGRSSGDEGTAI